MTLLMLLFLRSSGPSLDECVSSKPDVLELKGCLSLASSEHILSTYPARDIVDLSENSLSKLPRGFVEWANTGKVRVLFLSDNAFTELPAELSQIRNLQMLSMRRNKLKRVNCDAVPASMIHLIVTDNYIKSFTGDCEAQLYALKKLMAARNQLEEFDLALPNIELIRLPQNLLKKVPRKFLDESTHLKWAGFSENPCCQPPKHHSLKELGTFACDKDQELGAGTSGVAISCRSSGLVFKQFKPTSTDGSAESEIKVSSLLPREHPVLLSPKGLATWNGYPGIVYRKVDAAALGLPPFVGCDDRFPMTKQKRFSSKRMLEAMVQVVCGMADMHKAQVVHMDLYAHNTLLSESEVIVLDFGAAVSLQDMEQQDKDRFKKIDLRAYGRLVENMLEYVVSDSHPDPTAKLQRLKEEAFRGEMDASKLCSLWT